MRVSPMMENLYPSNAQGRQFALCESCFWSATILFMKDKVVCPLCFKDDSVALIPLAINESYLLTVTPDSGLEVSFSVAMNTSV